MSVVHQAPSERIARQPFEGSPVASNWGLLLAVVVLVGVMLLPTPAGLPVAGQVMLGDPAFAVIVWMTEAVDYAVSAVLIAALMAFLLGLAPRRRQARRCCMGTSAALGLALGGFANTALALVAAALFLSAAMTVTGLDRRIALVVLSKVGAETRPRGHRRHPGRHRARLPRAVAPRRASPASCRS